MLLFVVTNTLFPPIFEMYLLGCSIFQKINVIYGYHHPNIPYCSDNFFTDLCTIRVGLFWKNLNFTNVYHPNSSYSKYRDINSWKMAFFWRKSITMLRPLALMSGHAFYWNVMKALERFTKALTRETLNIRRARMHSIIL